MELHSHNDRDIEIGAVLPNRSTHAAYRNALIKAVDSMAKSYGYWIDRVYTRTLADAQKTGRVIDPYATDAKPKRAGKDVSALFVELKRLDGYWTERFDKFAKETAKRVVKDWLRDNTISWQSKLRRSGYAVKLQLTKQQETILKVKIEENVSLIKSIQKQYHTEVEGIVSRSFLAGRDLNTMASEIKKRHGVSTRKAALIARDQSNKATAQMNAARQNELGIVRAVWIHSSAGKEPRPDHVRAGRERWEFDPTVGIDFGDGFGFVKPGEAINCRCTCRSIIPALKRGNNANYDMRDLGKFKGVLEPLKKSAKID